MKARNMSAGLALVTMIIAGVLLNAPGCIAGGGQRSPGAAQYTSLISPFKCPSTAPVVITVLSDFQ